jgi:hypothetical protein
VEPEVEERRGLRLWWEMDRVEMEEARLSRRDEVVEVDETRSMMGEKMLEEAEAMLSLRFEEEEEEVEVEAPSPLRRGMLDIPFPILLKSGFLGVLNEKGRMAVGVAF